MTAKTIGILELLAAVCVLVRPVAPFILVLFLWKMLSESFYLHYGTFEWIERGGSYGAILALWFATSSKFTVFKFNGRGKQISTA